MDTVRRRLRWIAAKTERSVPRLMAVGLLILVALLIFVGPNYSIRPTSPYIVLRPTQAPVVQQPTSSPVESPSASPTASATSRPQPTRPPSAAQQVADRFSTAASEGTAVAAAVFQFVVLILALVLAALLALRLWRWASGTPNLTLDQLTDGTGDDASAKMVAGTTELFREQVGVQLRACAQLIEETNLNRELLRRVKDPLPASASPDPIRELGAGKDALPEPLKSVVAIAAAVVPRRALQVSAVVQKSDENGMGMTVTVSDLGRAGATAIASIWETRKPTRQASPSPLDTALRIISRIVPGPSGEEEESPADPRDLCLPAAAYWTAVMLTKFVLERQHRARHEQAQVANFCGYLLTARAHEYGTPFDELAQIQFEAAIALDPDWFTPYENLADTLSFIGAANDDPDLQLKSIERYDDALTRVGRTWAWARPAIAKEPRAVASRRGQIQVARAISQLLTKLKDQQAQSGDFIKKFTQGQHPEHRGWRAYSEKSADLLNSVASWYAVAAHLEIDRRKSLGSAAQYLLLAAIAAREEAERDKTERGKDFLGEAREDSDLSALALGEHIAEYREVLAELLALRKDKKDIRSTLEGAAARLTDPLK
jgi:hypothetical protein